MEKVKAIAAAMAASMAPAAPTNRNFFSEILDINDYPSQARRRVTQKNALNEVIDRTGVAIISRGFYVPPGTKIDPNNPEHVKLHLILEAQTEMQVMQAKAEILRMLEDATLLSVGASTSAPSIGRYSVV